MLQVFGLLWPVEVGRQKRLHLKRTAGVSCNSLEALAFENIIKMGCTIVARVVCVVFVRLM